MMAVGALRGQFATASLLANCALARSPEIARQPRHERCGESVELARLWVVRGGHAGELPARSCGGWNAHKIEAAQQLVVGRIVRSP